MLCHDSLRLYLKNKNNNLLVPALSFLRLITKFSLTADSGVSSTMQLEDLSKHQNGPYQSQPETICAVQSVYSPPAQLESSVQQALYQQTTAQASQDQFIQESIQLHQGAYQQTTGQLHAGTYQQPAAQLHLGPDNAQTVRILHFFFSSYSQLSLHVVITCFYVLSWNDI